MTPPFRLGFLGTGQVTAVCHLPAALASTSVEITALVDPTVDRARALARDFGIDAAVAADPTEILDRVDGVVIASPNHTHHPLATTCIEAGVHCLIEKPLATTVEEAESVCRLAADKGVVVAVGYYSRFRNEVAILRDVLRDGYYGTPRRFLYQEGGVGGWSPVSGYNLDKKSVGGGLLMLDGIHFLDRMIYWFGYPTSASIVDDAAGGPEAHFEATFHYDRGGGSAMRGMCRMSKVTKLPAGFVVETDRGSLVLPTGTKTPLVFRPADRRSIQSVIRPRGVPRFPTDRSLYQVQIEDFVDAARTGREPTVPGVEGIETIRLIAELYGSRRSMQSPDAELVDQMAS